MSNSEQKIEVERHKFKVKKLAENIFLASVASGTTHPTNTAAMVVAFEAAELFVNIEEQLRDK